jgi:hypothetical protein
MHNPETLRVQRLTVPEYIETVKSLFEVDVAEKAVKTLPRDLRADGFSNTAYRHRCYRPAVARRGDWITSRRSHRIVKPMLATPRSIKSFAANITPRAYHPGWYQHSSRVRV